MILVTAEEMRALDRYTIERHGTPGRVLMERAGAGAERVLRENFRRRGRVVVVAGRGNNGGDGFVVARQLARHGWRASVCLLGEAAAVRGDAALMLSALRRARVPLREARGAGGLDTLLRALGEGDIVVDALLGTGLNAPVTGLYAEAVEAINASGRPVLAIDIPSGLCADTGQPLGVAVQAEVTATFGFPKLGQVLYPGASYVGRLAVVDIGIPPEALAEVRPQAELVEEAQIGALLGERAPDAHKGDFGHLLIIAGSRGKTGAAILASEAAMRAGAGLVTLASAGALNAIFAAALREVMTAVLPDGPEGTIGFRGGAELEDLLAGKDAVVVGPGLGVNEGTRSLVRWLVRRSSLPLVIDADGLNCLADDPSWLRARPGPTVLTPHPGELARLAGTGGTAPIQADRAGSARRFAAEHGCVVVLKGAGTVIAAPDGRLWVNPTGNPGMASGGTGDVLAGMVGALLARGLGAAEAARAAVYLHGAAGDRGAAALEGEAGLVARDLIAAIPAAMAGARRAWAETQPLAEGAQAPGCRTVRGRAGRRNRTRQRP